MIGNIIINPILQGISIKFYSAILLQVVLYILNRKYITNKLSNV